MTKRKLIKGTHKGAPSTRYVFLSFPDLSLPLSLFLSLSLCRLSRDTNDDNATFARRRCCFFAKSSISLNFDRSFFSFLPVSLRRYEIFGGDEFFFLFFSKEEERKRESV